MSWFSSSKPTLTPQARAERARYEAWKVDIRKVQPEYKAWLARRAEEYR